MPASCTAPTNLNCNLFIYIFISLLLPIHHETAARAHESLTNTDENGRNLTREYHLRQGAIRGFKVRPSRVYDFQSIEVFLGIPYAAPPIGSLRFMPPVSAPPWPGVKMATKFAPVCPQTLPPIKKGNPPSLGRQHYRTRLEQFLKNQSEDCLYLNIYVPFREQKTKKFPILVFIHGDSFEWSSGNSYDGKILSSYGNIMVITVNYRLGILGFLKPSLTEHVYGNNGLLDQLAALQWIKDNIEDLNGDPKSVTIMGHGSGAACVNFLMLSPISNGLFHRAILMSGSALSDWAMTKDPSQYTLQVAQSLGCNPNSKEMMSCLQNKPLTEIKRIQILSRDFETPLGPIVAGAFIPSEPINTMESYPHLLSRYQLLCGVTEWESYHDFGVIELDHGILENQRDDFITKYVKIAFEGGEDAALKEILKHYAPSVLDPQRWSVEVNREVVLNAFSDARTLAPLVKFANYHSKANRQSYFYVFGHNSVSTEFASLNKSVNGEELPYVFGVPLGGAYSHFHTEYTQKEKLLSEVTMRLWTNFVKIGRPNTQSSNEFYTLDRKSGNHFNLEWPEYDADHQSYLRLDIPPLVSGSYRSNFTKFWSEALPSKLKRYIVDPLYEFTPAPSTIKPKSTTKATEQIRRTYVPPPVQTHYSAPSYGRMRPYSVPGNRPDPEDIYREIQAIKTPARPLQTGFAQKPTTSTSKTIVTTTDSVVSMKTSGSTITLIVTLCILFLAANIAICSILYFKKRKLKVRERTLNLSRQARAELGDIDMMGRKGDNDDALQKLKNGCSVIKSMSFSKIKNGRSKTKKSKPESCKTGKSDDSGGFREKFRMRRHLSTSTLDAQTKVRDWIANEVMHRCSPNNLRKSNSDISTIKDGNVLKPYTRSEEILSEPSKSKSHKEHEVIGKANQSSLNSKKTDTLKTKTSQITSSTSAVGSQSSIESHKYSAHSLKSTQKKSSDSLKSKGTESVKSKKVSVAVDATPAARTASVLIQEPIEISKSLDSKYSLEKHSDELTKQNKKTEKDTVDGIRKNDATTEETKSYTSAVSLPIGNKPLNISHKHSTSDPVTDYNYDKTKKDKIDSSIQVDDLLPPVLFRNDINVTSREEPKCREPMSSADALMLIKRRNFPKVLPDLPKLQKRLSLQPNALQSFKNYVPSMENQAFRSKVPPQPPPRTTTLERRLAYQNSKGSFSSFDGSDRSAIVCRGNYENIDKLSPLQEGNPPNRSFEHTSTGDIYASVFKERRLPRVIIASSDHVSSEPKIIIQSSPSNSNIPANAPRVRLPDDFHSEVSGSITSFSSFASDDEEDDIEDIADDFEDTLLKELVGRVDSPPNMEEVLDTKGPDLDIEKKLELVPVKINAGRFEPKNKDDYVCISDLLLPDIPYTERTAQIRPNLGLNKLQYRSEGINKPPEKAVKLKPKRSAKPSVLLNLRTKESRKSSASNRNIQCSLEHSNSGSSNDTESSTGTVKKVDLR